MKLIEHSNESHMYMMHFAYNKTNTFLKMKNCAENTIICIYFVAWGIQLEISHEIAKKNQRKKILRGNIRQRVEKMKFDNGQQ